MTSRLSCDVFSSLTRLCSEVGKSIETSGWSEKCSASAKFFPKPTPEHHDGCLRPANHHFLGHIRRYRYCAANRSAQRSEPRDCPVCAYSDGGHLLVVLAVLLHGPDESPDRTETAPEHDSDYGSRVGQPTA